MRSLSCRGLFLMYNFSSSGISCFWRFPVNGEWLSGHQDTRAAQRFRGAVAPGVLEFVSPSGNWEPCVRSTGIVHGSRLLILWSLQSVSCMRHYHKIHCRSQLGNQRGCHRRPPDAMQKSAGRRKTAARRIVKASRNGWSRRCATDGQSVAQRMVKASRNGWSKRCATDGQSVAQRISRLRRCSPDSVVAQPPGPGAKRRTGWRLQPAFVPLQQGAP